VLTHTLWFFGDGHESSDAWTLLMMSSLCWNFHGLVKFFFHKIKPKFNSKNRTQSCLKDTDKDLASSCFNSTQQTSLNSEVMFCTSP
jgi:hypothetical protein